MTKTIASFLGAAVLLLALATPVHALRCGSRLIDEGDSSTRLLRYCGEPTSVSSHEARRLLIGNVDGVVFPGFVEEVLVEKWTYNFGPNRLMRVVRIENGVVTDIEHLGYGFHHSSGHR